MQEKRELEVTEKLVYLKENTEDLKTMDGSNKKKLNGEMKEVRKLRFSYFWPCNYFTVLEKTYKS